MLDGGTERRNSERFMTRKRGLKFHRSLQDSVSFGCSDLP